MVRGCIFEMGGYGWRWWWYWRRHWSSELRIGSEGHSGFIDVQNTQIEIDVDEFLKILEKGYSWKFIDVDCGLRGSHVEMEVQLGLVLIWWCGSPYRSVLFASSLFHTSPTSSSSADYWQRAKFERDVHGVIKLSGMVCPYIYVKLRW